MMGSVDYTRELAALLRYVSRIALAIRLMSAYGRGGAPEGEFDSYDLMHLSDALHNFDQIETGIEGGPAAMVECCDRFIDIFGHYAADRSALRSSAHAFDRAGVPLNAGIAIFRAIRAKALQAK